MNQILDIAFNKDNNNIQIESDSEDNYVPNQALLDVIQGPNPPY